MAHCERHAHRQRPIIGGAQQQAHVAHCAVDGEDYFLRVAPVMHAAAACATAAFSEARRHDGSGGGTCNHEFATRGQNVTPTE